MYLVAVIPRPRLRGKGPEQSHRALNDGEVAKLAAFHCFGRNDDGTEHAEPT